MKALIPVLLIAIGIAFLPGCSQDAAPVESAGTDAIAAEDSTPVRSAPDMSQALGGGHPATETAAASASPSPSESEPEVEEVRQVAVAGVGKKGSRYGGGVITQPISSYFGARERITFISIQKAMRTFKALHERDPESHEEFMKEIVEENGLSLPSLFEGERYEYDPELGELMVVKPKK